MQEVHDRLIVANEISCTKGSNECAIVHACKSPCHQRAVGYRGNLQNTHPNYLVLEEQYDLYLNIIDPPVPLFMPLLFIRFMNFSTKHWNEGRKLLIHCNQGESRAPSLALLFMAKSLSAISNNSYYDARSDFEKIYPNYKPGKGIEIYFAKHWNSLGMES